MDWKNTQKAPCKSCPFRKDAKRYVWHPEHFINLARHASQSPNMGPLMACHLDNKDVAPEKTRPCTGWLLDQRSKDVPSLRMRMAIVKDEDAYEAMQSVDSDGLELFEDVFDMAIANLRSTEEDDDGE